MLSISRPTLPVAPAIATLNPMELLLRSPPVCLPEGRRHLRALPRPNPGRGREGQGSQTILVVLAAVLVERRDAPTRPAQGLGTSNAKSAMTRPRMKQLRNGWAS